MTRNGALAAAALVLGAAAAVTGNPVPGLDRAALLEADAAAGRTHVIAVAEWIRAREPGLALIDLRRAADTPRLPGAIHRSLADLDTMTLDPAGRIVVYGDEPARAAQAWLVLRLRGHRAVSYLEYGIQDWTSAILAPVLPDSATDDERAAWPRVAELSRYFGGLPSRGGDRPAIGRVAWMPSAGTGGAPAPVPAARRVGCGF